MLLKRRTLLTMRTRAVLAGMRHLMARIAYELSLPTWGHGFAALAVASAAAAGGVIAVAAGARLDRDVVAISGDPTTAGGPDLVLIGTVSGTLILGSLLAVRVVVDPVGRKAARFAVLAAVTAALSEIVGCVAATQAWFDVARVAAVIAICSALPAAVAAVAGSLLTSGRLIGAAKFAVERDGPKASNDKSEIGRDGNAPATPTGGQTTRTIGRPLPTTDDGALATDDPAPTISEPAVTTSEPTAFEPASAVPTLFERGGQPGSAPDATSSAPFPTSPGQRTHWANGYRSGDGATWPEESWATTKEPIGIGLSGGGIRAASVMLGALQDPTFRRDVLLKAKYLVSVSGGGFTAGAFVQALTAEPPPALDGTVLQDPQIAFAEGTVEEDHIRRHASYIARNAAETLGVLALLARHLVLNLILLFGPAVGLGVLAMWFYQAVPFTSLKPLLTETSATVPPLPAFQPSVWYALLALAILAGIAWLLAQWAAAHQETQDLGPARGWVRLRSVLGWTASAWRVLLVTVGVLTVGLPMVVWAAQWVLRLCLPDGSGDVGGAAVSASIGTVLLTYLSSLAALVWRKRANLKASSDPLKIPAAVPRGFGQLLLVILAITVLAAGWLLVFGGTAVAQIDPTDDHDALFWAIGVLTLVVVLGAFTDETTLSLHPFYRRRVARAFAVRTVRDTHGTIKAEPYDADERTTLSTYGAISPTAGAFPEVIFAASATLGGTRTPPGSNRVSYTFGSRFVGGPAVGYIPTAELVHLSSPRLRRDLTVQGAVALSGAALAASVGAQNTKWYETLFAVTGVRLGAWMPNPRFLTDQQDHGGRRWYEPGLPKVRRMSYLLRELFGLHPADAPLVQVTDGGFYDNLGLIELFRRGCTTIYVIDASGDNPPPAATLADVISLAYQELGVQVNLEDTPFPTTPGTGKPGAPRDALTSLTPRLSKSGVITGTFTYPAESGLPEGRRTGKLVVAKASLWPELPYQLQAYAMRNPVFPHDSTADQWFDDGQYGAYTALGRALGAAAVTAVPPVVVVRAMGASGR
jgi:hypothetical protein